MDGEQTSPFILRDHSGIQSRTAILPESKGEMLKNILTHFDLVCQEAVAEDWISAAGAGHGAPQDSAPAQAVQQQSSNAPCAVCKLCGARAVKIALSCRCKAEGSALQLYGQRHQLALLWAEDILVIILPFFII